MIPIELRLCNLYSLLFSGSLNNNDMINFGEVPTTLTHAAIDRILQAFRTFVREIGAPPHGPGHAHHEIVPFL